MRRCNNNYSDVLEIVTTDFYMDDIVKAAGSSEEALQLHQQQRQVLGIDFFNLIKWCSNSGTFCKELEESLLTNKKDEFFTKNNRPKVLVVSWFPLTDMFAAHMNKHSPDTLQKWTQQKLSGLISRLFDTLENTAPVTIVLKIKLQGLWGRGQQWYRELREDLQQFVEDKTTNSAKLKEIQIPRLQSAYRSASRTKRRL